MAWVGEDQCGIFIRSTFHRSASSSILYMRHVVPVPEGRQVAVSPALTRVLGGGLAVHLQHSASGFANHAPQEVDVVYLARCGCGLVRLVEALQDRAEEPLALADDARRLPGLLRLHSADLRYLLGRVLLDRALSSSKPMVWAATYSSSYHP